ncbi:MAG: mercury transporter MerT [Hyphomicrobiales bacterium]|nr:mercury transporter MerT [Hyphomicrobiales bacterium]
MTSQSESPTGLARPSEGRSTVDGQNLLAAGGILAALGAASCCVIPFVLFVVGVTGAWIGDLTALEPYQPIFATVAVGCLALGFYFVYRRPETACSGDSYCARPAADRTAKFCLWAAAALLVIALGFPRLAPLFL